MIIWGATISADAPGEPSFRHNAAQATRKPSPVSRTCGLRSLIKKGVFYPLLYLPISVTAQSSSRAVTTVRACALHGCPGRAKGTVATASNGLDARLTCCASAGARAATPWMTRSSRQAWRSGTSDVEAPIDSARPPPRNIRPRMGGHSAPPVVDAHSPRVIGWCVGFEPNANPQGRNKRCGPSEGRSMLDGSAFRRRHATYVPGLRQAFAEYSWSDSREKLDTSDGNAVN